MLFSARTLLYSVCSVSLCAFTVGCSAFKATDKIFGTVNTNGTLTELPPEFIGTLPQTVLPTQVVQIPTITPIANSPVTSNAGALFTSGALSPSISTIPSVKSSGLNVPSALSIVDPRSLSSNQIRQLQQGLIGQGFNPDRLSGVFGRQTEDALGAFMAFNYPGLPLQRRVLEMLGVTF